MIAQSDVLMPGEPELAPMMEAATALMAAAKVFTDTCGETPEHYPGATFAHAFTGLLNAAALPLDELFLQVIGLCVGQVLVKVDPRDIRHAWQLIIDQALATVDEISQRDAEVGRG